MALIVEDGSIVEGANTYATAQQIVDYAASRGITINIAAVEKDAINAMDYLLKYNDRWKGRLVEPGIQPLAWPRKCVVSGTYTFPDDAIPASLISAQAQLAIYSFQGIVLLPASNTEAFVKREKIGPIETEYSETVQMSAGNYPYFPAVEFLLGGLLNSSFRLRSVRV